MMKSILATLFAVLLLSVFSTHATTIRSGSDQGANGCTSLNTALTGEPCFTFQEVGTIVVDGSTDDVYEIDKGDINEPTTVTPFIDVVDLGDVTTPSTTSVSFDVPVSNTDVSTGVSQIFACNSSQSDGQFEITDSNGNLVAGDPCTPDDLAWGSDIAVSPGSGAVDVTVSGATCNTSVDGTNGTHTCDVAMYTSVGNLVGLTPLVSAPEPGSFLLLGIGMVALAGLRRWKDVGRAARLEQ